MMKRFEKILCVFTLVFVFSFSGKVFAAQTEQVYDDANLLTESEMESVQEEILSLEAQTGWDVFAVSTDNAGGKSAMAYADDFFDTHTSEDASGVVFLIDMDNREIYISTCGEAIRYLTDLRLDDILDDAYYDVSDGEYYDCFVTMIEGVLTYYDAGIPKGQNNLDVETGAQSVYRHLELTEILVVVAVALGAGVGMYFIVVGHYQMKFHNERYEYRKYGKLTLRRKEDRFLNATHTQHRIQSSGGSSGGSRSGRSSTHRSSSGRSHGGSGRKF